MAPLFRSLFRGNPAVVAAPGKGTASTGAQPPNLLNTTQAGIPEYSSALTWEQFWAVQNLVSGRAWEDYDAIQTLLTAQIDWLTGALNLLQPEDRESSGVDAGIRVRRELSRGKLNEGTINAAVAKILASHFWPFVAGPRADEIRAAYKEHSNSRPAVRLLAGDDHPVQAAPTAASGDPRTVSAELVADILGQLTTTHDLANEDRATRTAEIRKRVHEQQVLGADPEAAASKVLDDLDRYIGQQQNKYRVNAKRGVKPEKMIWRSRAVAEICGCPGCISVRTRQKPWLIVERIFSPEEELRHALAEELQSSVPRKYLEILQLELVVAHNVALDDSPYTCHRDRVQSMTSLVISLFDTTSDSPEVSYLTGLLELLDQGLSPARGLIPPPRQIRTWQDAEENAAGWMRYMGYTDARVTNGGADGGIDVVSRRAVAQVKREAVAVGSPIVQRFYGAAIARGDFPYKLFFSGSGYSRAAREDAQRLGIALFDYHLDGWVEPMNATANAIFHQANAG